MKAVIVSFPVIIYVNDGDTLDSLMNQAAYVLETSSIEPTVTRLDGQSIQTQEELESYVSE